MRRCGNRIARFEDRIPTPVRFAVVKKLLDSKGYRLERIEESHRIFVKPGVRPQSVPVHHNQVLYVYYRKQVLYIYYRKAQKAP